MTKRISEELERQIVDLYDTGMKVEDICSTLSLCNYTVHNYLRKHDKRRNIVHTFDDNMFSVFTQESCYWAGFLAADGSIGQELRSLRVGLERCDRLHLEKLLRFSKDEHPTVKDGEGQLIDKNTGKTYSFIYSYIDINSVKIVKDLNDNFNITPAKSFTIQPPDKIPEEMIKHYIRGYFDGDGTLYWNKIKKVSELRIDSASESLVNWARKIFCAKLTMLLKVIILSANMALYLGSFSLEKQHYQF